MQSFMARRHRRGRRRDLLRDGVDLGLERALRRSLFPFFFELSSDLRGAVVQALGCRVDLMSQSGARRPFWCRSPRPLSPALGGLSSRRGRGGGDGALVDALFRYCYGFHDRSWRVVGHDAAEGLHGRHGRRRLQLFGVVAVRRRRRRLFNGRRGRRRGRGRHLDDARRRGRRERRGVVASKDSVEQSSRLGLGRCGDGRGHVPVAAEDRI
mmetsp:Transcript_11130/g.29217  ORF Transcript_11130/g.29217 Transcript_11130/m.29217 type:complete len:211 (-) Transcript_11130:341-973(-)